MVLPPNVRAEEVIQGRDWTPPRDYSRANGLVEEVRQSYFELEEAQRLEEESMPREELTHEPSPAIDLPEDLKVPAGGYQKPAAKARRGAAAPAPKNKAKAKKSKRAPQKPAKGKRRTELEIEAPAQHAELTVPLRINPMSRSVNITAVE